MNDLTGLLHSDMNRLVEQLRDQYEFIKWVLFAAFVSGMIGYLVQIFCSQGRRLLFNLLSFLVLVVLTYLGIMAWFMSSIATGQMSPLL